MNETILENLNEPQLQAVTAPTGNLLVLAGAGSGKTRVLVHRIAWLMHHEHQSPFSILAVTFTNKAAAEMRVRVEGLIGESARGMWIGTFHGLAHRLLRMHWQEAGLQENFQILDSEDQLRLIKRVLKAMNLDESHWPPREIQWFINGEKEEARRPKQVITEGDHYRETLRRIYQAYEEACERSGSVDFSELLLRAFELFENNTEILAHYQQRFRHILVDEFQDTNALQYNWIRLFAGPGSSVMIVGDDDQSIYGWRGAKIENIHRFTRDYADAQMIRLEQNYRSTAVILQAANALIAHNEDRLGKELWTEGAEGETISLYGAFNEIDESRFIVDTAAAWIGQGYSANGIAVLYRSNAQSRVLEETLIRAGIPYRVYGGLRFFDRMEIKDALAYLRLIANRHDDMAFERVVNTPTRGIGNRTLVELRDLARMRQLSLWDAARAIIDEKQLAARASNALLLFLDLINHLEAETASMDLASQLEQVLQDSGLWQHFAKTGGSEAQSRLENLSELITAAKQYEPSEEDNLPPLSAFLSHAALESGEAQAAPNQECVQLMTLHSAKGLEFPLVFMAGMEEGLFPHKMSIQEEGRLQEERRLCYVGMTRAMKKLYLTYAELRRQYGSEEYHMPSRFISEIPSEFVQPVRHGQKTQTAVASAGRGSMPNRTQIGNDTGFALGQTVNHPTFGQGTVINFEGQGQHARVQVNFANGGAKWLVLAYAKLEGA
jgi:DNA helicase-2/ATP-dependent DNA helicase PcrA